MRSRGMHLSMLRATKGWPDRLCGGGSNQAGYSNLIGFSSGQKPTCVIAPQSTSCSLIPRQMWLSWPQPASADPGQRIRARRFPRGQPEDSSQCHGRCSTSRGPAPIVLGSSCIYPKFAAQPITEASLMTGELEATNDAYAVAKIAGIKHVQALRRQYTVNYISAMPTNLYGPGDNFNPTTSHVLPALIRRIHEAKSANADTVTIWGSGTPRREFLLRGRPCRCTVVPPRTLRLSRAHQCRRRCRHQDLRDLAGTIAEVVGWQGEFLFDSTKPDGTPRKLLDVSPPHGPGMEGQHSSQGRDQAHL